MFLPPESIKKIGMKTTKKIWKHPFPHYKSMGVFLDIKGQRLLYLCGPILSKFELILDIIHVLNTYKFKMDWINTKQDADACTDAGSTGIL